MRNVIFGFILLLSASSQNNFPKNSMAQTNINSDDYSGTYEYVYLDNTSDLKENHFIVLAIEGGKLTGVYYGTSDEFDEAREGYLPGFFVTKMDDLKIISDTITFTLKVNNDDFLTAAIDLKYKSTKEAINAGYKNWENKIPTNPKYYKGTFKDSKTLYFKGQQEFLDKTFKKK
jgi:hypothetical protein